MSPKIKIIAKTKNNNEGRNKMTMAETVRMVAQKIDKRTDNRTKMVSSVPFESFIW